MRSAPAWAVHGLRETQRTGLNHKISHSISPPPLHTVLTRTAKKVAVAAGAPLTPGCTPYPSFPFRQGLRIGPPWLPSALFVANLDHGGPECTVWCGRLQRSYRYNYTVYTVTSMRGASERVGSYGGEARPLSSRLALAASVAASTALSHWLREVPSSNPVPKIDIRA